MASGEWEKFWGQTEDKEWRGTGMADGTVYPNATGRAISRLDAPTLGAGCCNRISVFQIFTKILL